MATTLTPPPAALSPEVIQLAGRSGLIPLNLPSADNPNRRVGIPFVLVPLGMQVIYGEEVEL